MKIPSLDQALSHIFVATTFQKIPTRHMTPDGRRKKGGGIDPNVNATPRLSQIWSSLPSVSTLYREYVAFQQGYFIFGGKTGFIILSRASMSFIGGLGHICRLSSIGKISFAKSEGLL